MSETRDGPTPNGGVKSEAFYFDAENKPCEKDDAALMKIVEYDAEGGIIHSTYLKRDPVAKP